MSFELDIIQTINNFEKTEQDLKKTVKAQKAMQDNIPFYLEKNLEVLKNHFPNLYKKFNNYTLVDNYKLTCNSNGEPNIVYPDGHYIYSSSPFSDCKKQVKEFLNRFYDATSITGTAKEENPYEQLHFYYKNEIFSKISDLKNMLLEEGTFKKTTPNSKCESVPNMFMFGLGLGFQLGYLYEQFTPLNLYVIEPRTDFFYLSLCVFDYSSLIDYIISRKLGLKFFIGDDQKQLFIDIENFSSRYPMNFTVNSFFFHYKSDLLDNLWEIIKRDYSSIQPKTGFFDDILIGMAHSYKNITAGIPLLTNTIKLPKKYTSAPLLLVGNGPSLDNELPLIKKYNDKLFIVACGTALSALVNYGIKVDIYVAVERTPDVYKSLQSIDNHEVFESVLCIVPDTTYPDTIQMFKNKVIAFKGSEIMLSSLALNKKLKNYSKYFSLDLVNPLVSNMGVVVASYLNFSDVYLIGIDCGTAYEEAHSRYSMYYDNKKLKKEYSNMLLNNNQLSYPGNFSNTVKTNNLFKISIRIMERVIKANNKSIHFFNASNGAKIEGCIPKHLDEINFDELLDQNHNLFKQFILNKMSESISISRKDFNEILRLERSSEIIDTLIQDLNHLPSSRPEIILRLEAHIDFINDTYKEGLTLCYGSISGSLSLLYCGLVTVLYIQSDESKAIDMASKLVPIIIDFLKKAKELLAHTYEYTYDYIKNNIKPIFS